MPHCCDTETCLLEGTGKRAHRGPETALGSAKEKAIRGRGIYREGRQAPPSWWRQWGVSLRADAEAQQAAKMWGTPVVHSGAIHLILCLPSSPHPSTRSFHARCPWRAKSSSAMPLRHLTEFRITEHWQTRRQKREYWEYLVLKITSDIS